MKSQSRKSDRELDLENKLAIVLAENEKLNQILQEIHDSSQGKPTHETAANELIVKEFEEKTLENEELKRKVQDLNSKIIVVLGENEKLNLVCSNQTDKIKNKEEEIVFLSKFREESEKSKKAAPPATSSELEEIKVKYSLLMKENDKLHLLLSQNRNEIGEL